MLLVMERDELAELGKKIRVEREAHGLTLNELAYQIRPYLPEREWVTGEAIRSYESAEVKKMNIAALTAICRVLDLTLTDVSPSLARDAQMILDLLGSGIRCNGVVAGRSAA